MRIAMIMTKVGRRGQVTVPKEIQRLLKIQEGDRLAFIQRGDEVILRPLSRTLKDMRGSVPVSNPQDFDAIRRQVLATHGRKVATDDA
jgi:AbrB family looped-hinge helix DNA binding protein